MIRSGDLVLEAANGQIGSSPDSRLQLDLKEGATVTARAQQGIHLHALGSDMRIGTMFSQSGDLWLSADGSILDGLNHGLINMLANNIHLTAGENIGRENNFLEFATRPGGVINAQAGNDIYLDTVDGSMTIGYIEAGEHVYLRALHSILGTNGNELAGDIKATTLRLETRIGGVGQADRLLAIMTDDEIGRLDLDSADTAFVREVLGSASLGRSGDLRLGQVRAGSDNTLALIFSEVGNIFNALDEGEINILSYGVYLVAQHNIGRQDKVITTATGVLQGESREGQVYLNNSGHLVIDGKGLTAAGDIEITTNSPMTVSENLISHSGNIYLYAMESSDPDDNGDIVTFTNGVLVEAEQGSIFVSAGDGIVIEDDQVVLRASAISIYGWKPGRALCWVRVSTIRRLQAYCEVLLKRASPS